MLYANKDFLFFIQLYQLFHSRLSQAKTMALASRGRSHETVGASVVNQHAKHAEALQSSTPGLEEEQQSKDQKGTYCVPVPHQGDIYAIYWQNLLALLLGKLEVSQYEDSTRELFGMSAWYLCSMATVYTALTNQVEACVNNTSSLKVRLFGITGWSFG